MIPITVSDIHVGDILRIRDWDDMAEEFGLDRWGDINCKISFTKEMQELCGCEFIVKDVDGYYVFPEGNEFPSWNYSADMLEPMLREDLNGIEPLLLFDF